MVAELLFMTRLGLSFGAICLAGAVVLLAMGSMTIPALAMLACTAIFFSGAGVSWRTMKHRIRAYHATTAYR